MGFKFTADKAKVYRKDVEWSGGTFASYSLGIPAKKPDGSWNMGYMDCAFKKGVDLKNKTTIEITNAFPTVQESKGKKYVKMFISEYKVLEEGEDPKPATPPAEDASFMNIPDNIDDELPFK